jgi:hypothetical protein
LVAASDGNSGAGSNQRFGEQRAKKNHPCGWFVCLFKNCYFLGDFFVESFFTSDFFVESFLGIICFLLRFCDASLLPPLMDFFLFSSEVDNRVLFQNCRIARKTTRSGVAFPYSDSRESGFPEHFFFESAFRCFL